MINTQFPSTWRICTDVHSFKQVSEYTFCYKILALKHLPNKAFIVTLLLLRSAACPSSGITFAYHSIMFQLLISALPDISGVAKPPLLPHSSHTLLLFYHDFEEYEKEADILQMSELFSVTLKNYAHSLYRPKVMQNTTSTNYYLSTELMLFLES